MLKTPLQHLDAADRSDGCGGAPSPERLNRAVEDLVSRGDLAEGLSLARSISGTFPGDAENWNNLGAILFATGEHDEAVKCLETALSLDPGHAEARANLAAICRPAPGGAPAGETETSVRRPSVRNPLKVLLVVCLYEHNFGDILIYLTIDGRLKQAGFLTETVELSRRLDDSHLIERANACDFLYFVGGGIIERWAPEIIARFDTLHPLLKVPYGMIGLSTGDFDYRDIYPSLRRFSDNATFFYTRDEESVETFRKAGATRLPQAGVDVVFANNELAGLHGSGTGVTASFRNIPYPDVTGEMDWGRWAAALKRAGVTRLLHDCSDAQLSMQIPVSSGETLVEINRSSLIVAMRFHVILVAALMGVPTVPVAYCPKVARLAEQLGLADYCLGIHDHHRLEETVARLTADAAVGSRMAQQVSRLRQTAAADINSTITAIRLAADDRHARPAGLMVL